MGFKEDILKNRCEKFLPFLHEDVAFKLSKIINTIERFDVPQKLRRKVYRDISEMFSIPILRKAEKDMTPQEYIMKIRDYIPKVNYPEPKKSDFKINFPTIEEMEEEEKSRIN